MAQLNFPVPSAVGLSDVLTMIVQRHLESNINIASSSFQIRVKRRGSRFHKKSQRFKDPLFRGWNPSLV